MRDYSKHCYLEDSEYLTNWGKIQLHAPRSPTHSKRAVALGPWPSNTLLTFQTASPRTWRPVQTLQWPEKGTVELLVERQYFIVMALYNIALQFLPKQYSKPLEGSFGFHLTHKARKSITMWQGNCSWSSVDRAMEIHGRGRIVLAIMCSW